MPHTTGDVIATINHPGRARRYVIRPGLDGGVAALVHHDDGTRERLRTFFSASAAVRWAADRLAGKEADK